MKFLIFLAMICFVSVVAATATNEVVDDKHCRCHGNVYQQPLIKVESKKTKMMKDGTWDAYYKQKVLLQQTFNTTSPKNLKDFDELEYVADIFIGDSSPQPITVHYDLTSSDFWIPDVTCGTFDPPTPYCPEFCTKPGGEIFCNPNCKLGSTSSSSISKKICNQKRKFDSSKSGTFTSVIIPRDFNKEYEFGYITASNLGRDEVILEKKYQQLNTPTVPTFFSQTKEFSPAFLDTPFDGILGLTPGSFMTALRETNDLDKDLFTIWISDKEYDADDGFVTFGGIDSEHCSSKVIYQSRRQPTYEFFIRNITYASTVVQEMAPVIVDMSRTSIYGPADSITKIKEAAGAREDGMIDCEAKIGDITFGDETAANILKIPAKNLIIKNPDGSCNLAVGAMPPLGSQQSAQWIFGTPWLRSYCNVFTFGLNDEKIGFARVIA